MSTYRQCERHRVASKGCRRFKIVYGVSAGGMRRCRMLHAVPDYELSRATLGGLSWLRSVGGIYVLFFSACDVRVGSGNVRSVYA